MTPLHLPPIGTSLRIAPSEPRHTPITAAFGRPLRFLLWIPFICSLWGLLIYLLFGNSVREYLFLMLATLLIHGTALFGPRPIRQCLEGVISSLYALILLGVWICGLYVLPTHPGSPIALLSVALLAPVVYTFLFLQHSPRRARLEALGLAGTLVMVGIPHTVATLRMVGPFVGVPLPLIVLTAHGALIIMLHHFAQLQVELSLERERTAMLGQLANHDVLTGLRNRRAFEEDLVREVARSERHNTVFGVIVIDVDGLKRVNDTHGHDAGDALLVSFGKALTSVFRAEDQVFRLGGDEFAVLLVEPTQEYQQVVLSRVQEAVGMVRAQAFPGVGASAGVAFFPADGIGSAVMTVADRRMYESKRSRNPALHLY
ncbi:GGDEF domain-containing protein [Deinococcus hopiensis]|uniref:Diguanylate cyclase (GGDEF) domain-containing protein n=1 Tax=Deinococcus hopiensis KR-140 TaxID=695939 RepID=A0A1W1UR78_9DEIO|nr:GGDEF domain-containing protein [Deinococcus hopiensis]SMB83204.1 diguanylate cyclase (GGDEF) domain-containing protein [Deinococcus hopiensis KR-140]